MNVKIPLLAFALIAMVIASGCVSEVPDGAGPGDGETLTDAELAAQQQEVLDDLDSDLIDENEEIDIGDLI